MISIFSANLISLAVAFNLIRATSSPAKGEPLSFLPVVDLGETFSPFIFLKENLGFIPNLFRAQTLLPRVIETEAKIVRALLFGQGALSRKQKECILLSVSAANQNTYCFTAHWQVLRSLGMADKQLRQLAVDHHRAGLSRPDVALLDFGLKLTQQPTYVSREDIQVLRRHDFSDEAVLEAVMVAAFTDFICTLSVGLGAVPDFRPKKIPLVATPPARRVNRKSGMRISTHTHEKSMPYLRAVDLSPDAFPPFAFFRERFGFIPNLFRAQTLRPNMVAAEADAVRTVLLTEDVLSRVQKEYILLVVSAANLNTYCVAVHCEMLRGLGVPEDESDQIAVNHRQAGLSGANIALLDFALTLSQRPTKFGRDDVERLQTHGFTNQQILESVVMTALTTYLNTLQIGLGTVPDFEPKRVFGGQGWSAPQQGDPVSPIEHQMANLFPTAVSLIAGSPPPAPAVAGRKDVDGRLVARVQGGDLKAFEELVQRHQRRIYRTLIGITGNAEDAEDGTQDAFLKAFEHIGEFQGGAAFSTWLTRIAINEGLSLLRKRRKLANLDDYQASDEEEFRPRQVQAWDDNPEQLYTKTQMRELIEEALMKLPSMYRVVVMLRDIEQLSTEEAAAALGVGIANLKSRLLRGRLMLREALAPYFVGRGKVSKARV